MNSENEDRLKKVAKRLGRTRAAESEAWTEMVTTVRDIYGDGTGPSYLEIANILGVTRARVYQIVNNNTKNRRPPHPIANKDVPTEDAPTEDSSLVDA